jgi:poly(hydroxyalkanoate) depolymerase family esterase
VNYIQATITEDVVSFVQRSLIIAILAGLGCLGQAVRAASLPNETAWANGTKWRYEKPFFGLPAAWIYTPTSYSTVAGKRGLVFHLMGCGQVVHQSAQGAGWGPAADANGVVVVVPAIVKPVKPNPFASNIECYDYGVNGIVPNNSPDQLAIIKAAKAMVADPTWKIDPNQVYLAGLSAGATLALEISCMAPDLFSGVVAAAGAGIGSNQSTAIMPPTINAGNAATVCKNLMAASPNGAAIKDNVYILVSDDNSLPACSFSGIPFCMNNFNDQTVWDGDKFCPHIYNRINAEALATVMGLTQTETGKSLGLSGAGIGCAGGEKAKGDKGYVKCKISNATQRSWTARADTYKDAQGRVRIIRIEQDTLRHAWPTGSKDTDKITPSRKQLASQGYIAADGSWNLFKVNSAPNGVLGAIYFNPDTIDLPMLALKHFAANNPKIKATSTPGPGPCADVVCPEGERCDPTTGNCRCTLGSCPEPKFCDSVILRCIDPSNPTTDSGLNPPWTDAGTSESTDDGSPGCACSTAAGPSQPPLLILLLGVWWLGRRNSSRSYR